MPSKVAALMIRLRNVSGPRRDGSKVVGTEISIVLSIGAAEPGSACMPLMKPAAPEFEVEQWLTKPQPERVRAMCETWAMQGFGAPGIAYVFYVFKLALYVGG